MKIKTSELKDLALNWAVAKCVGGHIGVANGGVFFDAHDGDGFTLFEPTINWAQGGPIIEREKIGIWPSESGDHDGEWCARKIDTYITYSPTPLIAAMRCYVASKLGDEVEIPEEINTTTHQRA